ncbi:ParA family protein (plasmid) [Haloarcula sp. NS06]
MGDESTPRAVSVGVLKGGFGKTTTAINLDRKLAHRNERDYWLTLMTMAT